MRVLVLTSLLFGTIVLHAYHMQNRKYHHLFMAVTLLSVAFHSSEKPSLLLRVCDTALAHIAFLVAFAEMVSMPSPPWLWTFPIAIACLWILEHCSPMYGFRVQLHAALHLTSLGCVHCLLHFMATQPAPRV